jgi:hypothetical protein
LRTGSNTLQIVYFNNEGYDALSVEKQFDKFLNSSAEVVEFEQHVSATESAGAVDKLAELADKVLCCSPDHPIYSAACESEFYLHTSPRECLFGAWRFSEEVARSGSPTNKSLSKWAASKIKRTKQRPITPR